MIDDPLVHSAQLPLSLTTEEKRELYELLLLKARRRKENWLAGYRPYPKQLEFHAKGAQFRERLLAAGNQLGKTLSAGAEVACHLTGRYPDWWTGRRFQSANRWLAGSESAELTRKGVQRILFGPPEVEADWGTGSIPKDCLLDVSRRQGVADAIASAVIKHEPTGDTSTIQLQSYDQGRMQHVDSRVLTPSGWRRIGDLVVGDRVIAGDGSPTRVAGVFPHGLKDLYELMFDSGAHTLAGAEHLWAVQARTNGAHKVVETAALIQRYGAAGHVPPANDRVSMPHVGVVQFDHTPVLLDPYLVGALLGDGCLRGGRVRFTSSDPEIAARVGAGAKAAGSALVHWGGIQYGLTASERLTGGLREYGMQGLMAHEKRVPQAFLVNAPEVRLAVLQGLMDTDGSVSKKGSLSFASTSLPLAEDVAFLARSFGGKARITSTASGGRKRVLHKVAIRLPQVAPFRLQRKLNRLVRPATENNRHILRSIRAVEPGEAVCIAVEHSSALYVTDDFIVTHNTKWQADTVEGVWFDEEPPLDIYSEGMTRTNVAQGIVMVTFTPLLGMSDVVKRFMVDKQPGSCVVQMTIADALHYTEAERAAVIAGYPEHEREARANGVPMMGSGRVFPLTEAGIKYEAFSIPAHWPRICGWDFGIDHPAAMVWMAWDRDSDTIYVYDVWRESNHNVKQMAQVYRPRGAWIPCAWPHDGLQRDKGSGEQLAKQAREAGAAMLPNRATFDDGTNGVEAGVSEMLERFQTRRLRVAAHLAEFFEEFRMYHRKDGLIVKKMDDIMSACRYGIMMKRFALTQLEATGGPFAGFAGMPQGGFSGMGIPLDAVAGY